MVVTVIGVQISSFATEDGRTISGANVYYTYEKGDCNGLASSRSWFPSRLGSYPSPGDVIKIYYTKFGKVASFEVCPIAG